MCVCLFSLPADPDSQLYDMGYPPEEEAPACPDEFDDFVTFEASMSSSGCFIFDFVTFEASMMSSGCSPINVCPYVECDLGIKLYLGRQEFAQGSGMVKM